jgi:uncharacterized SAM-binding protein YcdF (DUF218 family)
VDLAFTLKAIFKALVLPPTGPMLVALVGLLLLRRAPRIGRALVWTGALTLVLLCLPVVAGILARPFDMKPLDLADAKRAQAIVVLGGGTRRAAPEYGGDTLGRRTLERVRYGARVARETGLPVLVTGGVLPDVQSSEAALMREALEREYGVPVRWAEDRSRNTRENARLSAPMLKAGGVTIAVLVAHAIDMPRAQAEFAAAGIEVVPAPTGLAARAPTQIGDFVPSAPALQASHDAVYEILANVVRVVAGD